MVSPTARRCASFIKWTWITTFSLPLLVLILNATWSKHCGKVQKHSFKIQTYSLQSTKVHVQSTKAYFQSTKFILWRHKSQVEEKQLDAPLWLWDALGKLKLLFSTFRRKKPHATTPLTSRCPSLLFNLEVDLHLAIASGKNRCQPGWIPMNFQDGRGSLPDLNLSYFVLGHFTSTLALNLILVVIQDGHLPSKSLGGDAKLFRLSWISWTPRTLPSTRASPDFWTMVSSSPN